jgi:hypothetical protein
VVVVVEGGRLAVVVGSVVLLAVTPVVAVAACLGDEHPANDAAAASEADRTSNRARPPCTIRPGTIRRSAC